MLVRNCDIKLAKKKLKTENFTDHRATKNRERTQFNVTPIFN